MPHHRRTPSGCNLDRYESYLRAQVKELITGYGPLLLMWYDVPQRFDQEAVTTSAIRLNILDATEGPTIWEIKVGGK